MQKLLIVTRHTPLPWEDGAGAYLHDVARFLASHGFSVDVLWLQPHDHLRWRKIWPLPVAFHSRVKLHLAGGLRLGRRFIFPGIIWLPFKANCLHHLRRALLTIGINPPRRSGRTDTSGAKNIAAGTRSWMSPPSEAELALVQRFSKKLRPDVVVASYAWMCPIFTLPALQRARHACLAHDILWKRAALSLGQFQKDAAPEVTRQQEADWLQQANLIVAISAADAEEIRALVPEARIMIAPKALEAREVLAKGEAQRLLFVGSDNAFNAEGLEWFLLLVWPLIRQERPDTTLDICGSISRSVQLQAEGVTFHGPVANLDAYYQRASIAIVPLLRATGMNIKLVEAATFGRAIVATPVTLLSAPFLRNIAMPAQTAGEFANAVLYLIKNSKARETAGRRALSAVKDQLIPLTCYGPLSTALAVRH